MPELIPGPVIIARYRGWTANNGAPRIIATFKDSPGRIYRVSLAVDCSESIEACYLAAVQKLLTKYPRRFSHLRLYARGHDADCYYYFLTAIPAEEPQ